MLSVSNVLCSAVMIIWTAIHPITNEEIVLVHDWEHPYDVEYVLKQGYKYINIEKDPTSDLILAFHPKEIRYSDGCNEKEYRENYKVLPKT